MTLTNLPGPKYWTHADVQALPEDGNRYEVIDGELIVSPSPIAFHQVVSRRLQFFFYQFEIEERGYIFNAPMDLVMPGCTPVQPDLIFLLGEQFGMIKRNFIDGAPHLLVEVLSPSTARIDRIKKLRKYAQNGVHFYLLADPDNATLEVYELDGANYRLVHALEGGDTWHFRGKMLDIAQVFAPLQAPSA